jgi:DNA replication and repair protein RecF
MEARIYGSQGQQRTVALALKLAEFQLIEDYVGEPPVMLLDDVMSDLDDARRRHLLGWVQRRCQTFLTCTNLRAFPNSILQEAKTFHVVAGRVIEDETRRSERAEDPAVPEPGAATGTAPRRGDRRGSRPAPGESRSARPAALGEE